MKKLNITGFLEKSLKQEFSNLTMSRLRLFDNFGRILNYIAFKELDFVQKGIEFDKLKTEQEVYLYRKLKREGFRFYVEPVVTLVDSQQLDYVISIKPCDTGFGSAELDNEHYTKKLIYKPDFFIPIYGRTGHVHQVYIELKGGRRELRYLVKKKLILFKLNEMGKANQNVKYWFFELHNNDQIDRVLNELKQLRGDE